MCQGSVVLGCIGPCVKYQIPLIFFTETHAIRGTHILLVFDTKSPFDLPSGRTYSMLIFLLSARSVNVPSLHWRNGIAFTSFPDRSSWTTITFPSDTPSATRTVTIQGKNCWMSSPTFLRMNPVRLYSSRILCLLAIFFWVISSNWSLDTSYSLTCVRLRVYTFNHYVRRHSISQLALDSISFSVLLRSHHWPLVLT